VVKTRDDHGNDQPQQPAGIHHSRWSHWYTWTHIEHNYSRPKMACNYTSILRRFYFSQYMYPDKYKYICDKYNVEGCQKSLSLVAI